MVHMRTIGSQSVLAILASILLLSPQFVFAQTCSITFQKNPIQLGEGTNLQWSVSYLTPPGLGGGWYANMQISNIGTVGSWVSSPTFDPAFNNNTPPTISGSTYVSPSVTTNYSGSFYYGGSSYPPVTCPATLTVVQPQAAPPPPPPQNGGLSCSITFDQNPINSGDQTHIRWSSTGAQLFYINDIGYVGGSGSAILAPSQTTDYSGYVNDKADETGTTVSCPAAPLVVSNTQQCPPGYTLQNGACVFPGSCPIGYVQQGNTCVFSACPSGYVLQGNTCVLSNLCSTPPRCSGNDLVNSCTGATIQSCAFGCASGACSAPPALSATLNAAPSLLHVGNTTTVSWSATNANSCSVHGTNGDSWNGTSSSGQTSSPIQGQTIYTLHCIGVANSNPPTIDKQATVNIIPVFNEQ